MTSSTESIEVIEAIWKIPNFLQRANSSSYLNSDFRKNFFIAGRVPPPPAHPKPKSLPIKLEVSVFKNSPKSGKIQWILKFCVCDMSKLPFGCTLIGNFLEFRTFLREKTATSQELKLAHPKVIAFSTESYSLLIFEDSVAENYVDKADGSLNIYFKMKFTFNQPSSPESVNFDVTKDVSELSNDFESLFKTSRNADVVIKASLGKGQTFRCHKLVLAARSPVFCAMFESDMKEAKANVVEVDDILPKTMHHFLSFIYCGRFQDSSWIQSLPQLAYTSDKYCVNALKNLCDSQLIRSVTFRNALALGKLAERHGLKQAAQDIRKFIAENADELTLDTEVETNKNDADFKLTYTIP